VDPVLGSLVYQLPGVTLAYNLHLGHTIAHWKGIIEEIHFGGSIRAFDIIEEIDPEKPSFRPSKWPWKFRNRKTAKNSKLPENCFELVGIGGWPPISTWINQRGSHLQGCRKFWCWEDGCQLIEVCVLAQNARICS
jgi:hypothetical protein